jgi:phosphoglycolate phosphatase
MIGESLKKGAQPRALPRPSALLFDLDGTLIDTAPDMLAALVSLRDELGLRPIAGDSLHSLRSRVSRGAIALMEGGLPELGAYTVPSLRTRYLELYQQSIAVHSRLFPGLDRLLACASDAGVQWGIVTNKPVELSRLLLAALGLKPHVLLGGDSLPEKKPHPLPVLTALRTLGADATTAWMIGDDPRDIEAGRAAGCCTIACAYGYSDDLIPAHLWGSDLTIDHSQQLEGLLERALSLPRV